MTLYTSYEVMRRRKHYRKDTEARVELGTRMRAMYLGLGMDRNGIADFLQVSSRTLHNWESGKHVIPFAVYKLLRLLTYQELPGRSWIGWSFVLDKLVTPEGRTISGTDSSWWSLLVRRAHGFDVLFQENQAYRQQLAQLTGQTPTMPMAAASSPAQAPSATVLARDAQGALGGWGRFRASPMVITGITPDNCHQSDVKLMPK